MLWWWLVLVLVVVVVAVVVVMVDWCSFRLLVHGCSLCRSWLVVIVYEGLLVRDMISFVGWLGLVAALSHQRSHRNPPKSYIL